LITPSASDLTPSLCPKLSSAQTPIEGGGPDCSVTGTDDRREQLRGLVRRRVAFATPAHGWELEAASPVHRFALSEVATAGGEIPAVVDSGEIATNRSGPAIGLDDFDDEHQKATFLRVSGRIV
jgi:hypothetical protein